ncbi:hypothetical protein ACOSQ2_003809 [Xanthoceras sorbifolium]
MPGSVRLRDCEILKELTSKQAENKKLYGAICAAPAVTLLPWVLLRKKQISNGLGAIFGLIQLVIYACYYRKTLKSEDVVKLPEVQLSGAIRCAPERKPAGNPNY